MKNTICFVCLLAALLAVGACKKEPVVPPDPGHTGPVVYDPDVQTIMFNNCLTCHGGPAPSANLRLEDYVAVRAAAESGNLLARINDEVSPMPPAGRIRREDRDRIAKWIADGFPEK